MENCSLLMTQRLWRSTWYGEKTELCANFDFHSRPCDATVSRQLRPTAGYSTNVNQRVEVSCNSSQFAVSELDSCSPFGANDAVLYRVLRNASLLANLSFPNGALLFEAKIRVKVTKPQHNQDCKYQG
jgi:hypothetical protein